MKRGLVALALFFAGLFAVGGHIAEYVGFQASRMVKIRDGQHRLAHIQREVDQAEGRLSKRLR